MGPLPRSLTAEANSCFMVRVPHGPNRIQGCGASIAPERGLPSDQLYQTSNNEGHRVAVTLDTKVLIQGCLKTRSSKECAELSSLFSSFDGDCQSGSFLIQRNRDKLSTRKFDVGVFTQPGSKPEKLNASTCFPLFTQQRTSPRSFGMSVSRHVWTANRHRSGRRRGSRQRRRWGDAFNAWRSLSAAKERVD